MLSTPVRLGLAALSLTALFLSPRTVQAQTVYSDRSTFESANPDTNLFGFSGIAPLDGFVDYSTSNNALTLDGLTFSQPDSFGSLDVISKGYYKSLGETSYALDNSDFLQAADFGTTELDIALPIGTSAFGADFGTFEEPGQIDVLVNGIALSSPIVASDSAAGSFFGYSSLTPITTLAFIDQNGDAVNINNVEFSTAAAPVPEASSAISLSLLLCLGGAAFAVRRQKQ